MSLPGLLAHPLASSMGSVAVMSPLDSVLGMFNTNAYFIGFMMLILNLGGRFMSMEVTKRQEQFLQHPWVRRCLIFVAIFIATRNVLIAFWLTIVIVILFGYLFNENSAFCIFGKGGAPGATCKDGQDASKPTDSSPKQGMTPEETEIFRRLNEKRLRYDTENQSESKDGTSKPKFADPHEVYRANLSLLNN